jgi:hypothetical protein
MNRALLVSALWLASSIAACSKEAKQVPETQAPTKALAPSAQLPLPTPKPLQPSLSAEPPAAPTQEDFEEDAARDITSKNLEAELDRLEKELKAP